MSRELSSFCADWIKFFPQLQRFNGGRKLLLRAGTIVYGIELKKIFSDTYRPEFICLNLLSRFNEFALSQEISLPRNPQGNIKHSDHSRDFLPIAQKMQERIPLLGTLAPRPGDIVSLYRENIEREIKRGASPIALMTSLIQQSVYHRLPEVEAIERRRLKKHFDSLSHETARRLGETFGSEISMTFQQLDQTMHLNMAKSGWPENLAQNQSWVATGDRAHG